MKNAYTEHDRKLADQASKRLGKLILPLQMRALRLLSTRLRRLHEYECNGCTREKWLYESWNDYDKSREKQMESVARRVVKAEKQLAETCAAFGIEKYYIQGDPRGCALYIGTNSDERYSTEGIAIY